MRSNLVESRKTVSHWVRLGVLLASFGFSSALIAQGPPPPPPPPPGGIPPLPPVPQPAQNPGTPEKELL